MQKGVLSEHQFEEITAKIHKREKRAELFQILTIQRDVEDFIILCDIIRNSSVSTLQDFGYNLLIAAYNICRRN